METRAIISHLSLAIIEGTQKCIGATPIFMASPINIINPVVFVQSEEFIIIRHPAINIKDPEV